MNTSTDGCRCATARMSWGDSILRGGHSQRRINRSAVEKTELWKPAKTKSRFPPVPTPPWKSRPNREIPTSPPRRRRSLSLNDNERRLAPPKLKAPKRTDHVLIKADI